MATATLNLRVSPRRILTEKEAAEYCGIPVKRLKLDTGVSPIVMPSGARMYDIRDLDAWIDGFKAGQPAQYDDVLGKLA